MNFVLRQKHIHGEGNPWDLYKFWFTTNNLLKLLVNQNCVIVNTWFGWVVYKACNTYLVNGGSSPQADGTFNINNA